MTDSNPDAASASPQTLDRLIGQGQVVRQIRVAVDAAFADDRRFDHPVGDWPNTVLSNPAKAMGVEAGRLDPGTPADFILFKGRSWTELLSRPESQRVVYRDGVPIDAPRTIYDN